LLAVDKVVFGIYPRRFCRYNSAQFFIKSRGSSMKATAWTKIGLALIVSCMLSVTAYALSDSEKQAMIERIKPVGEICLEGDESCAGVVVAAPAASARTPEDIYNANCTACHSTGAAGAPRIGHADEWAPRVSKGMDTLYLHAIQGFNAMPPKGMCMNCSDDELHATVDYIIGKSK
jgi:cytochrome c5